MTSSSAIACTVVLVGLENSGKTTLAKVFSERKTSETFPTAGFEIFYVNISSINSPILVYDCSGQGRSRAGWRQFFEVADGIIYVVDSCDVSRTKYVKESIEELANDKMVRNRRLPIMLALNKGDKPSAVEKDDLLEMLNLTALKAAIKNPLSVKETEGITGKGVEECFQWIHSEIRRYK